MNQDIQKELQTTLGASYVVEQELGGGGMSHVFLAEEVRFGRRVVIKLLPPELSASVSAERFQREISLAAGLQHPNIIPVLSAGEMNGLPWYSMPYVDGESLRERTRRGALTPGEGIRICTDVARALAYAHERGIVHRDIKPENMLISGDATVVADFGIAKAISVAKTGSAAGAASLTVAGSSVGTPAYMAPEQAVGDAIGFPADVYAWGVVAYELLSGHHPFQDAKTAQQLIAAHVATVPRPLSEAGPGVDPTVARLVDKCLLKDPSKRPANGSALLHSLRASDVPVRASGLRPFIIVAVLAIAVTCILMVAARQRGRGVAVSRRVAVAPFRNVSGDRSLDPLGAMAADWLVQGLSSTDLVDVVTLPADTSAGPSGNRKLAREGGASLYVAGSYYRSADSVQFQAQLIDVTQGSVVAATPFVSALAGSPMAALNGIRQRVLALLAARFDPRLIPYSKQSAQPPSYQSYLAYTAGVDAFTSQKWKEAAARLESAFALDSGVARALVLAGVAHMNLGEWRVTNSIVQRLQRFRDRLPIADRTFLDWQAAEVRGDRAAILEAIRRSDSLAPGTLWSFEHGLQATAMSRPHEALSALQRVDTARGEARAFSNYWLQLTLAYHMLGDYGNEIRAARAARRFVPGTSSPLMYEARAEIARGDTAAALRLADSLEQQLTADRDAPARALVDMGNWAAWHGHPSLAQVLARRSLSMLTTHVPPEASAIAHRLAVARALKMAGTLTDAEAGFRGLIAIDSMRLDYVGSLGVLAAERGDAQRADSISAEIGAMRDPYLFADPLRWRARIAARLGRFDQAVAFLRDEQATGLGRIARVPAGDADLAPLRAYAPFRTFVAPRD